MGQGPKWTREEKELLVKLVDDNASMEFMKVTLGRTKFAIRKKIWELEKEKKESARKLLLEADMDFQLDKDYGEGDIANKLAIMSGMKRAHLPLNVRKHIAGLVMGTERWLMDLPRVDIEAGSAEKEAAVLMVSDLHSGKKHYNDRGEPTYNRDIAAFRLAILKERLIHLLKSNLRPEKMDELHILLLGDIVDGSGIYPNQELNQDIHAVQPQVSLASAGIWDIIRAVRNELDYNVFVHGVRGNHGRQGKYAPAANNFDFMVYQTLRMLAHYEDPEHVSVEYSTTTDYLNFGIKGHRGHIRHEAPPQTETPAARAKFGGWREKHGWDFICYGHRHHPSAGTYMGYDAMMNGSFVGDDDLSELMAVGSRPSQTLFGVDYEVGVSFRYNLYLDMFGSGQTADELLRRYPALF